MLSDIREGLVNCVIVKDLSRFGRNYIESGRYIEKIFPMLGVRFIAINDSYDSLNEQYGNDMIVPFKNLINDAYCRWNTVYCLYLEIQMSEILTFTVDIFAISAYT